MPDGSPAQGGRPFRHCPRGDQTRIGEGGREDDQTLIREGGRDDQTLIREGGRDDQTIAQRTELNLDPKWA
jgi:hypothetical protein